MTLGRNPFEVEKPLEEKPPVRPPKAPTVEPPEGRAIPFEGVDFTVPSPSLPAGYGQPAEVKIMPDFEFVGTKPKLRSEDYLIFFEGKRVGKVSAETGEFAMDDPGFWWKAWLPSVKDRLFLSQTGQVPKEAFSGTPLKTQQQFADWLFSPKKIGETDIPAPATILSLVGLAGIAIATAGAAYSSFNLLLQSKLPAIYSRLPGATVKGFPKPTGGNSDN